MQYNEYAAVSVCVFTTSKMARRNDKVLFQLLLTEQHSKTLDW